MNNSLRTIFIAFLAALAGVLVGRSVLDHRQSPPADVHALMHGQLDLDEDQRSRLVDLERQFAVRRTTIELELRAANARLAEAIETEHGAGPAVNEAIDRSHDIMGRLQKETLAHIFAMRQLLRPDQARKFDHAVVKALTTDHRGQ